LTSAQERRVGEDALLASPSFHPFIFQSPTQDAKGAPLAVTKTIQGLRAVFDETYPNPVCVVSIGIPVEDMEADPTRPAAALTLVNFCGGTQLRCVGHIGHFLVASQEDISKGIRRIIVLTVVRGQRRPMSRPRC